MPWGSSERRSEQAERRLASISRAGRSSPGDAHHLPDSGPADHFEPHRRAGRWVLGEWTRSGVRGLAVLAAVAIAVAGYWAWSGRPRAVAVAPEVVSTGAPLPGASAPAPAPGPAPSATVLVEPAGPSRSGTDPSAEPVPDVVVHVIGLVARPGLVRLPPGSRVADAIEQAGGVTRPRASESVNLARVLVDGEQIVVAPAAALTPVAPGAAAGTGLGPPTGPLDLNSATAVALEALPGVGPVIAGRIVAWREQNGPFRSVEELAEVAGIGEAIITQVRGLLRV